MTARRSSDSRFDVWAPLPETLTLHADGQRIPMVRGRNGWWTATGAPDGEEVDYGYQPNGAGPVLPDPRSRRQPDGVHALSRTFNPASHDWADTAWAGRTLAGAVIYELHIGTFTPEGTFDAAIGKLPYLSELGVDFVEVLPVNAFNGPHNWGYDGVLWYAVHEEYGGPRGYQRFVDACHRHGLAVVQDVVYNHLGPSGNYLPQFGPYLSESSANTWGQGVNLDGPGSDEVREYILANTAMWFRDYHVDALRLDAVHALHDSRAVHILEELSEHADACSRDVGRPLSLIAESDLNDPRLLYPRSSHGYGLTGQWSDDFHHAVHANLTGESSGYYEDFSAVGALAKVLSDGFFHDGSYSSFRGRHHGRPLDRQASAPWQLVVCTQNHDQIGNRAAGDRLGATVGHDLLAVAAVVNLASPFTPMLFMGEEYGAGTPWQFFTSHPEPELAKATAEGRLREFEHMGWDSGVVPDPQAPETFLRSKLDWNEAAVGGHAVLLATYRKLITLRRTTAALACDDWAATDVEFSEPGRWLVMRRGSAEGAVGVAANFGPEPCTIPFGGLEILFSTRDGAVLTRHALQLPGHSAAIFTVAGGRMGE